MTKMQTTVDENHDRHAVDVARQTGATEAAVRQMMENFRNAVVKYDNKR